jgi:ribosomal protein S18 acetylase RimI-like enzyme
VRIELADITDAEAILDLQHLCYQSEAAIYGDDSIAPLLETLDQIKAEFERQVFLKATENERVVGSVRAYTENETCYVGRLIVHPDSQNRGIGTKLLLSVEATFMSIRRFELFTGDRSQKNLALYRKLDYREFKREKMNDKLTLVYLEKQV